MRNIYALILSVFCMPLMAQTPSPEYHIIVNHRSAPGACDATIEIQCANCPSGTTYYWLDSTGTYVVNTGPMLTNLCDTQYWVYSDASCYAHLFTAIVGDVTSAGTATSELFFTVNYDDSANYSGSAEITYLSGNAPYNLMLFNFDMGSLLLESYSGLPAVNGFVLDSLVAGTNYQFNITDSTSENGFAVMINPDPSMTPCTGGFTGGLWASAQGFPVSDSSLCDGTAYTTIYGGLPPYTIQYSSGSTSVDETNLCPGAYTVTITDANSSVYIANFTIGYPGTVFVNDPNGWYYVDTLVANAVQNCGIDFSLPIDTFYIDTSYSISQYVFVMDWIIVQDTNSFLYSETYYIPDSTQSYMFGLSVFCSQRSFDFGSYTFYHGLLGTGTNSAISELAFSYGEKLYPNPSESFSILEFDSPASSVVSIEFYDFTGRKISSVPYSMNTGENRFTMSTEFLESGYYSVVVKGDSGILFTLPLIKQ